MVGIYCIINKVNNKVYIGESTDVYFRMSTHRRELSKGIHINKHLQAAWNTYGENNFEFRVLEVLPDDCSADLRFTKESEWIDRYGGVNSDATYNLISGYGFGGHSQEVKNKISNTLINRYQNMHHPTKGRCASAKERQQKSVSHKGLNHSEETKRKISQSHKGITHTEEAKRKISQARLGKPSPMKGKHFSAEAREHMRLGQLNKQPPSEETRKKLSEACRRRIYTPVVQSTLSGDVIGVFRSAGEASRITGCSLGGIYSTCQGKQRSSFGYLWKYVTKQEFDELYSQRF